MTSFFVAFPFVETKKIRFYATRPALRSGFILTILSAKVFRLRMGLTGRSAVTMLLGVATTIRLFHTLGAIKAVMRATARTFPLALVSKESVRTGTVLIRVVVLRRMFPLLLKVAQGCRVALVAETALAAIVTVERTFGDLVSFKFAVLAIVIGAAMTRLVRKFLEVLSAGGAIDTKDSIVSRITGLGLGYFTVLANIFHSMLIDRTRAIAKELFIGKPVVQTRNAPAAVVTMVRSVSARLEVVATGESGKSLRTLTLVSIGTRGVLVKTQCETVGLWVTGEVGRSLDACSAMMTIQIALVCVGTAKDGSEQGSGDGKAKGSHGVRILEV